MVKTLSLEEGVNKIFELSKAVKSKPIVVALHGHPDSGKTHLRNILIEKVHKMGYVVNGGPCDDERSFNYFPKPDYIFIEDEIYTVNAENCAKRTIGRGVDIRVLIDNSRAKGWSELILREVVIGNKYDVIINNPDAKIKGTNWQSNNL